MKQILLAACILGIAVCAPTQFMEFDLRYAPAEALQAIPAGVPWSSLDVLLQVDDQKQPLAGPVRGFIKQEIPQPNGRESKDVYYAFGFDQSAAAPVVPVVVAPAAPAAPVVVAAPVAPVAPAVAVAPVPVAPVAAVVPVAPAAPVKPAVAAAAPAAKRKGDDDDDDDD